MLAPGRQGDLTDALAKSDARTASACARAARARGGATPELSTPFFLLQRRCFPCGGGRRNLLARLIFEANDAIDEFLALALAHERADAPSLLEFPRGDRVRCDRRSSATWRPARMPSAS